MKRVLPLLLALFIGSSAYAQGSGSGSAAPAAGSGSASGSATPQSVGGGSGSGRTDTRTTGEAEPVPGGGSAQPTQANKGPQPKAWYDVLADKPIEEEGTFWMPKAVNMAADESDMMFY